MSLRDYPHDHPELAALVELVQLQSERIDRLEAEVARLRTDVAYSDREIVRLQDRAVQ